MYTKTAATSAWSVLGPIAVACTLFAGNAAAGEHEVTAIIHVSTKGLDLSQPAGAQKFYVRLKNGADDACTRGDRVGLAPVANPKACYERSLADAIRSVNAPLVCAGALPVSHAPPKAVASAALAVDKNNCRRFILVSSLCSFYVSRNTQRKPMWLVVVSSACG